MATPLIRLPQIQGGTMYAFGSAARDLTRAYNNPDINFEFSKFALLDMPVFAEPSAGSTSNYIEFDKLYEGGSDPATQYDDTTSGGDANFHFATTFQNYALNLETLILSDDDFDGTLLQSDAEKIFFKYLHHIGGFRARSATSQEAVSTYSRAIEEDNSEGVGSEYSKVIRYVGNIDVTNEKQYNGETYSEVFINVPSSVGYTPEILLKSSDYNSTSLTINPSNLIKGRSSHPDPSMTDLNSLVAVNDGKYTLNHGIGHTINYGIEFDPKVYAKIVDDAKLNNLFDYSKRGGDFKYNAILVYYDLYSKSTPANRSTNLYGIIILDNWKDSGADGWYIPELTKYKPNEVTGLNGNAFALKLNIKFNSSLDNVGVETNINDYSTFSMDIFFDTTTALESAASLLRQANERYTTIVNRLDAIENIVLTSTKLNDLVTKVSSLESDVENATLNYSDSSSLVDLIASTNLRINQMIDGTIPTEIQYNVDVLKSTTGITIDKDVDGTVKIINNVPGYSVLDSYVYDIASKTIDSTIKIDNKFNPTNSGTKGILTRLKEFENITWLHFDSNTFGTNLNIYIDDSVVSFKDGQVFKIAFKDDIKLDNNSISIFTDKVNGYTEKITITSSILLSNKPYIEVVCTDAINKTLEFDIIR